VEGIFQGVAGSASDDKSLMTFVTVKSSAPVKLGGIQPLAKQTKPS
jgi:hypothetical protein